MATHWLRLWHELPNDPKWRTIARKSGQPVSAVLSVYMHMLVNASMATQRGQLERWEDEDVASALDLDESDVRAIREAMEGRVLDGTRLSGWERRQPAREESGSDGAMSSTERSRRCRQRKREPSPPDNGSGGDGDDMQRNATQGNAPETDTDTEKPSPDGEGSVRDAHSPASPAGPAQVVDLLDRRYPSYGYHQLNAVSQRAEFGSWLQAGVTLDYVAAICDAVDSEHATKPVSYCIKAVIGRINDSLQENTHASPSSAGTRKPGGSRGSTLSATFAELTRTGGATDGGIVLDGEFTRTVN